MKQLTAIIVDDEKLARQGLAMRLQQSPEVTVVAECANGQQALRAIAEFSPELVFLDIQMPGMSGFDVIGELQADNLPMIVFVTAFDEYAVEAFKVHAVDYLLKPIEEDRLRAAIERSLSHRRQRDSVRTKDKLVELVMGMTGASASSIAQMTGNDQVAKTWPDKLSIKDGNEIQFIKVDQIQWIDAAGDYMCVHANGKTHIMRITMKQLEGMLDPERFLRVHRSTIVNANRISSAQALSNGEYLLSLDDTTQLKVSRSYRDRIKELLAS